MLKGLTARVQALAPLPNIRVAGTRRFKHSQKTPTSSFRTDDVSQIASMPGEAQRPSPSSKGKIKELAKRLVPKAEEDKIEVLPFRVSRKIISEYLGYLASRRVCARVRGTLASKFMTFMDKLDLEHVYGERGWFFQNKPPVVKLKKLTPMYLPIWMVDCALDIKCKGSKGTAEATLVSAFSRFPGHTIKDLDSMPMHPPPPRDFEPLDEEDDEHYQENDLYPPAWDFKSQLHPFHRDEQTSLYQVLSCSGWQPTIRAQEITDSWHLMWRTLTAKDFQSYGSIFAASAADTNENSANTVKSTKKRAKKAKQSAVQLKLKQTAGEPEPTAAKKPDVQVLAQGGLPGPIPFSISPLQLPDMIRRQYRGTQLAITPSMADIYTHTGVSQSTATRAIGLLVSELGDRIPSTTLEFLPDTMKIDLMAAYPIYMPIYVAEYEYQKYKSSVTGTLTYVYGAWDNKGLQYCIKEPGLDWEYSLGNKSNVSFRKMSFIPRAPFNDISTSLIEMIRKKRRPTLFGRWFPRKEDIESGPNAEASTKGDARPEQIEENLEREAADREKDAVMGMVFVKSKSLEAVKLASWSSYIEQERTSYLKRTDSSRDSATAITERRQSQAHPAEPHPSHQLAPDAMRNEKYHIHRKAGLGDYIHWTSPHVQRFSEMAHKNQSYFNDGLIKQLKIREDTMDVTNAGYDVDRLLTATTKDGIYKTHVATDLQARQYRERIKPQWLKDLLASRSP